MNKYIPYNITCPLASCSRSNTCARYANYQKAKAEEASFMVLNTDLLQIEGEGCPYHLVSERQRWARGFTRLCKSIPSGNAKYLNVYTPLPSAVSTRQRMASSLSILRCRQTFWRFSRKEVPTSAWDSTATRSRMCW